MYNEDASSRMKVFLKYEWDVDDIPVQIIFSDGGEYVAVACYITRMIRLFSLKTGKEIGTYIHTQEDEVLLLHEKSGVLAASVKLNDLTMCFSPDAQYLITSPADNIIRIWDIESGKVKRRLKGHAEAITGLCLSDDGRRLASGSGRKVLIWNLDTEGPLLGSRDVDVTTIEIDKVVATIAFSPNSKLLIIKEKEGEMYVLSTESWKEILRLEGESLRMRHNSLAAMRFSKSGSDLTSATPYLVQQWDFSVQPPGIDTEEAKKRECIRRLKLPGIGIKDQFGFNSASNWIVSHAFNNEVTLYSLRDGEPRFTLSSQCDFLGQSFCSQVLMP